MNLHRHLTKPWSALLLDNVRYWSTAFRPMGGLFYSVLYRLFGFDPLPFRIACFVLLAVNLFLLYHFCRILSRSREVGFLALLTASYHAWFVDLYYSTGTVYDLLCFAFYFGAFLYYLRLRQAGQVPAGRQWVVLCGLYLAALNSKEMAPTLPLFLLIYELLWFPPALKAKQLGAWLARQGRGALVTGALTIPYVAGKIAGPGSLTENPAFRLSISPGRFLDTFHLLLNPLLYQDHFFRDPNTVQLLAAMLLIAILAKSRAMAFAWTFLLLSILPVAFIAHYSAFFLYIPMAGWALYGALAAVRARKLIGALLAKAAPWFAKPSPALGRIAQAVTFLGLAACLAPLHLREAPKTKRHFLSVQPPVMEMARELGRVQPRLPKGARILFVNDPYPSEKHFLILLARLYYDDLTVEVDKTSRAPDAASVDSRYDAVLLYKDGRLVKLR